MLAWVAALSVVPAHGLAATAEPSAKPTSDSGDADIDASLLKLSLGLRFVSRPRARPDWWRDYSTSELQFEEPMLEREAVHLVLQEDRPDGSDMMTLRYPFLSTGGLRAYAGAGLGQVVYLADQGVGPILLFGHAEHHRSVRAAAEVGTDLRLSDAFYVGADLRWLDLADSASLLRTSTGMIDAAPWAARLTLGWRFR